MIFKLYLPSLIAGVLGALLSFHPTVCVVIVVGCFFGYSAVHAITVSKMLQEQIERGRMLQSPNRTEVLVEPTTRAVALRAAETYLKKH